ncbi:MAG: hypothetical protein RLP09_26385 [Sandaracinaceae bacterium]|nr:hypothetical protein [Myxococcales bacterium]
MTDPLTQIRRAYRYIAAYERRVLDAIDVLDEAVRELGFERNRPYRWMPLYSAFPSRSYAPESWVWDGLPNYAMRYQWREGEPNTPGSRWVLADHVADTSFESRRTTESGEPSPLDDLAPAESSRSVLRWHMIRFEGSIPDKVYNASWDKLMETQLGSPASERRLDTPTPEPRTTRVPPLVHTLHCVDIAALTQPESLRELFVDPLVELLRRG